LNSIHWALRLASDTLYYLLKDSKYSNVYIYSTLNHESVLFRVTTDSVCTPILISINAQLNPSPILGHSFCSSLKLVRLTTHFHSRKPIEVCSKSINGLSSPSKLGFRPEGKIHAWLMRVSSAKQTKFKPNGPVTQKGQINFHILLSFDFRSLW